MVSPVSAPSGDRSAGFRWSYFLEYLPNQMAVFNPFTLGP
jgi:hypothetical protein